MDTSTDIEVLNQAKTLYKTQTDAINDTESELSSINSDSSDDEDEDNPNIVEKPQPSESLSQEKSPQKPTNQTSTKTKQISPSKMKLRSASDIHMKKTPFDPSIDQDEKMTTEKHVQEQNLNKKLRDLYSPISNERTKESRPTRALRKPTPQPTKDPTTHLLKDNYPIEPTPPNIKLKEEDPLGKGLTSGDIKLLHGVRDLKTLYPNYSNETNPAESGPKTTKTKKSSPKSRPPTPHPASTRAKVDTQEIEMSPLPKTNKPRDPTPSPSRPKRIKQKSKPPPIPHLPDDLRPTPKKQLHQRSDSLLLEDLNRIKDFDTIPDQKYLRQSKLQAHQNSYKPPSPEPDLTKTDSTSNDDPPTSDRPTTLNPDHPDLSHTNQQPPTEPKPYKFTPSKERTIEVRPSGETTAYVDTPSVNYLPTGTNITLYSRTKLPMNKFAHFTHENFISDPYEFRPSELLSLTTHNASDGFALNSLQWWFEHPHHAMISFATGKKSRGLLLHTPSVFKIPPALCKNKDARELTAVEGSQNVATLRSIDSSLNMFQLVQARVPTPSHFASLGFSNIDDHCPEWQREIRNICPTIALPSHITSMITDAGNSTNAKDIFHITMKIVYTEYRTNLRDSGRMPSITHISKQGKPIRPGEEPYLDIDDDFLWVVERYYPILALCWVSHRHTIPAIPNQFDNSRNPISKSWLLKFSNLVQKSEGNYTSVFQDPSRLLNTNIPRLAATPKLPLVPTHPTHNYTKINSSLRTIDEYQNAEEPPESYTEELYPPNNHKRPSRETLPEPDEPNPYDWFLDTEEKKDDPPDDWSQIRGPGSKRPANSSKLTPRQLEHLKRIRLESPPNLQDFKDTGLSRPDTPPPQLSPMNLDHEDNLIELNSPKSDKPSRDDYANALRTSSSSETAKLIEILTKSVERQTSIQQKTLEQNEKHFEARENKNISTATRITHLNNSTIDGRNPATELTELDSDLLKCKNVFEAKEIIELFLRTNDCTTVITLELTKALMRGKWIPDDRFIPQGWTMFQAIASPLQAMEEIRGSELERAHDDYKLNRKITPQQQEALMETRICIPRQMHYLSDQIKIMYYLTVGLTGPESKITEAMLLWWNFVDSNKALLINLQLNGHKLLPVQIAQQIEQTRITYFSQGQSKVPDPNILNSEQMMGLILGGNHQITICRFIMSHIENTGGPNKKQPSKSRNDQTNDNDTPNPNGQTGRPVFHTNHLPDLRIPRSLYRGTLVPALRAKAITMPDYNNTEECAKFCFLGNCHDRCPRHVNHTQVLNGSNRAKALKKSLEQAQNWYQTNKNPGAPDFH